MPVICCVCNNIVFVVSRKTSRNPITFVLCFVFLIQGYPNKKSLKRQCQWTAEDGIRTADYNRESWSSNVNLGLRNRKNQMKFLVKMNFTCGMHSATESSEWNKNWFFISFFEQLLFQSNLVDLLLLLVYSKLNSIDAGCIR